MEQGLLTLNKEGGPQERTWKCSKCDKAYFRKCHLQCHEKYQCGKEPQFQCPYCPKRCTIKSNLKQHVMTHFNKNNRNGTVELLDMQDVVSFVNQQLDN